MTKWIGLFLVMMVTLTSCSPERPAAPLAKIFSKEPIYIAHAGGGIDGRIYTNSLEAISKSIAAGFRLIELDFIETSDGHLVASHGWGDDGALSLKDFLAQKIYGKYTPVDSAMIRKILNVNPDLILVTDKVDNFELLLKELPFNDRMLVETFSNKKYWQAIKAGVRNPMFAINGSDKDFEFVEKYQVPIITVAVNVAKQHKQKLAELYQRGVAVLVYTSNEEHFNNQALVSAIYTDFCNTKTGRCNAS